MHVKYGTQSAPLVLVIVNGNGPSLFGRNWLKYIQLNWERITATVQTESKGLDVLLEDHNALFKDELGSHSQQLYMYSTCQSGCSPQILQA